MSGATVAALSTASLSFPPWGNISAAHQGTFNGFTAPGNTNQTPSASDLSITATWTGPGSGFKMIAVGVIGASFSAPVVSGTPFTWAAANSPANFRCDATAAVGPFTVTLTAAGYSPYTFTITLT